MVLVSKALHVKGFIVLRLDSWHGSGSWNCLAILYITAPLHGVYILGCMTTSGLFATQGSQHIRCHIFYLLVVRIITA
jgi:hypothetical protein